jgi:hypothetical protein
MRKELADKEAEKRSFLATFVRFGSKSGYQGYKQETLLFSNIVDLSTNRVVTDHAWFNLTKGFERLKLSPGTKVTFDARVKEYQKGYVNRRYGLDKRKKDFRLSHPTNVSVATTSEGKVS